MAELMDDGGGCRLTCDLSPGRLLTRTTAITTILESHPHEQTHIDNGRRLSFQTDTELEDQLRERATLEAECCPFLTLTVESHQQRLILTVTGPIEAQPQITELFG